MNQTRKIRLLKLAKTPKANHKRWYSQYCVLIKEGLVGWSLGMAYLTPTGEYQLSMLTAHTRAWPENQDYIGRCHNCKELYFGPKRSYYCNDCRKPVQLEFQFDDFAMI